MNKSVIGTEVEGYRIQEVLGQGGMGVVYKAEDIALSRDVALKRINPSLANDEAFLRRFRSEARALARIDSPYIVGVHALRQTEIGLLLVMEYVEGGTVKDLTREGPMDWQEALPIVKQMLAALEHAHGAEVIHRDIKPENVMLSAEGTVKVTDFGLAKVHRPDSNKTVTQGVFGTLNYMSPEQVQGSAQLDHRSDLYSLGMTIYEMLAGDLPFDEDSNEFTKMQRIVEEELPPPDELYPEVPERISALVMRAIEKDPDDRFQSAEEMREAFEAFEEEHRDRTASQETPEEPPPAEQSSAPAADSRWPAIAGLVVLLIGVAVGAYWFFYIMAPPRAPLSVQTDPSGANVFLDGRRVGTTPLPDTTVEGNRVQVEVQRAGYRPVDTSVALTDGQPIELDFSLEVKPTSLTIKTTPNNADVYLGDERREIGQTPIIGYPLRDTMAQLHIEREGYRDIDTTLSATEADQVVLAHQLEQTDTGGGTTNGGGGTNGGGTTNGGATGTFTLSASPSGTVYVDGERREAEKPLPVTAGEDHEIRIVHPENGACETTLTVGEGETEALTCHFEHEVSVHTASISDPFIQVLIEGENTAQTPLDTTLATGTTYEIEGRIQRGSYTIPEGRYFRRGAESDSVFEERDFTGPATTVTLQPSFEQEVHGITFQVSEPES